MNDQMNFLFRLSLTSEMRVIELHYLGRDMFMNFGDFSDMYLMGVEL